MMDENIIERTDKLNESFVELRRNIRELKRSIQGFDFELAKLQSFEAEIDFLPIIPSQFLEEIQDDLNHHLNNQRQSSKYLARQITELFLERSEIEGTIISYNIQLDIVKESLGRKRFFKT